jgi:hypothetical protein
MDNNQNNIKTNNNGNIVAGLIIIAVGASYMLKNVGFPFPEWLFSWPSLLIVVGVYSGLKHRFRNNAWIFLIGFGLFFMGETYFSNIPFMHDMPTREFLIPIMIIAVGVIIILRPRRQNYGERLGEKFANKNWGGSGSWQAYGSSKGMDSNDFLNVDSVFSGVQRTILSKNFQGGKVTCVFGGAEIDLTQADFSGTIILRLEAVFGGIKLIVPPHWQVMNEIDGVFHGVDDKRRSPAGAYNDINKTLVLKGSAVFGGIEIRSY